MEELFTWGKNQGGRSVPLGILCRRWWRHRGCYRRRPSRTRRQGIGRCISAERGTPRSANERVLRVPAPTRFEGGNTHTHTHIHTRTVVRVEDGDSKAVS